MTGQDEQERHDRWKASGIRTDIPHPGSCLVISHVTDELAPDRMHAITAEYAKRGTVFVGRSKEAIQRMFNGAELVDPGVVLISYRRPDSGQPDYNADRVRGYCGVARVLRLRPGSSACWSFGERRIGLDQSGEASAAAPNGDHIGMPPKHAGRQAPASSHRQSQRLALVAARSARCESAEE